MEKWKFNIFICFFLMSLFHHIFIIIFYNNWRYLILWLPPCDKYWILWLFCPSFFCLTRLAYPQVTGNESHLGNLPGGCAHRGRGDRVRDNHHMALPVYRVMVSARSQSRHERANYFSRGGNFSRTRLQISFLPPTPARPLLIFWPLLNQAQGSGLSPSPMISLRLRQKLQKLT